ncbi:hypothetical protein GYMLUDRAFT_245694 [Collybiopsis luxurians FD-317 M1]|uniref:Retrotransposon gag domain-containing protein n=1 Tax=Collybiopsis luxurians FD-317 M1 TaxID=944289 RepID=A0A0D0BTX7_9AGAR|nr:hypothetical protein GYMLUDRAFT_245694 [Collybiopsis luxurians FD-317 M1]
MSAINPRDKDIHLAKQYKERIHGDVGGSWVLRAQMESVTDELEVAMTTGDPHTSLKTQTKQEIFSPRAEHLQAGSSKVHIGGEIPLDAALRLERWAARDKYAVSTTRFANESHPPNHLGFRTDSPTYHRRETPETFHENNQLEGPGWNARGLVNSPNTTGPGIPFSSRYSDPGNTARVSEQQNQWKMSGPGQESARVPAEQYWRSGTREYRPYVAEPTYDYSNHASTYRGYGVAGAPGGPPGGPPYGGVMQTGGISDGNLERERGSRNGSFRGGSGGGRPGGLGGPGGPGSPGGPPDDPDDWGSNHDAYWHPANGWVAIPEFDQRKDRLNKEAKLDVKKPDPFDGSDRWKWEPFLLQVHHTFMAKPTIYKNDSDKIGFAVSYLTGAAATHYDNLLKQEEAGILIPALHTWIDFVAEFTLYFRLFNPARDAQVKLAWIKQMDNESFATFIIRFQEYAFKTGYNDTTLNYPQWVQRFQELDNSIWATNVAHSCGGNSGFGTYNPLAPSNPQHSNPRQGSNNNNPQQAGGQQGRNQGNWNNRQRGAAALDSNVNLDNISGTVYGQSEDFMSASSQNGNSGEGLENQGGNNGVSKNPGDEEFLQAIRAARTPEQVEEFC